MWQPQQLKHINIFNLDDIQTNLNEHGIKYLLISWSCVHLRSLTGLLIMGNVIGFVFRLLPSGDIPKGAAKAKCVRHVINNV